MAVQTRSGAGPGHRRGARAAQGRRLPRARPSTAPGIAELHPARPLRGARRSAAPQSSMLLRRAFSIHSVQSRGRLRRHARDRVRRARQGHRVARRGCTATTTVDIVGPLGRPFALPKEPVSCVLVAGGYGSAPMFLLADAAARPRLPRRRRARRGHRDQAVRRPRRQAHRGLARPSRPTTARWASSGRVTDVLPAVARAHRRRRRLRLRPDGDAAGGRQGRRRARRLLPVRGRGGDGLRHRRLHDVRAAGDRRRRRHPHAALVRRRPGLPGRPGALGRGRHRPARTRSARP